MNNIKRIIPEYLEDDLGKGGGWGVWHCQIELNDGKILEGYVQSDGHSIAEDTLEVDPTDEHLTGRKCITNTFLK